METYVFFNYLSNGIFLSQLYSFTYLKGKVYFISILFFYSACTVFRCKLVMLKFRLLDLDMMSLITIEIAYIYTYICYLYANNTSTHYADMVRRNGYIQTGR